MNGFVECEIELRQEVIFLWARLMCRSRFIGFRTQKLGLMGCWRQTFVVLELMARESLSMSPLTAAV